MESTPHPAAVATPAAPRPVAPTSLAAAVAAVPDPRRVASVTYPLAAVLALAVAALLAGPRSVLAITEWGARQDGSLLAALGFPVTTCRANRPCSASSAISTGTRSRRH